MEWDQRDGHDQRCVVSLHRSITQLISAFQHVLAAKPFAEVQKRVADLLQDRILVGHAVHNDLKALLLSHPRPQTRDTQIYAYKCGTVKNKRVALRNLVKQELDLTIQSGEHSSVCPSFL